MSNVSSAKRALSFALRHGPQQFGLVLSEQGWADVDAVLSGLASKGMPISREQLEAIVAEDAKGRYSFTSDGCEIRANQGHSVAGVAIEFKRAVPPSVLYHGTTAKSWQSIKAQGLLPCGRHHVHLSADLATATAVGGRRKGEVTVLCVAAAAMGADGHAFYQSSNGVWLAATVPPQYLSLSV